MVVVTVCYVKKSSGYPLFKISGENFGLGADISFANKE